MTNDATNKLRALAEQIKTQNRDHNPEIDRLANEIIQIASAPRPSSARKQIRFVKLIPPGAV